MKGSIRDPFEVLKTARVVAVVGASRNPEKDAYKVPEYLNKAGYRIIPVNPSAEEILGEKAYPSLDDIPDEIAREVDVVDVQASQGGSGRCRAGCKARQEDGKEDCRLVPEGHGV